MQRNTAIQLTVNISLQEVDGNVSTANVAVKGNGTVIENSMIVQSSKYLSFNEPVSAADDRSLSFEKAVDAAKKNVCHLITSAVDAVLKETRG